MLGLAADGCVDVDIIARTTTPRTAALRLVGTAVATDDEPDMLPDPPLPHLYAPAPGRTPTAGYRFPPAHSFPPVAECTREMLLGIAARVAAGGAHELFASPPHLAAVMRCLIDVELELRDARATIDALQREAGTQHVKDALYEKALARERQATIQEIQRAVSEMEYANQLHTSLTARDVECDRLRRENLELRRLVVMYGPAVAEPPARDDYESMMTFETAAQPA